MVSWSLLREEKGRVIKTLLLPSWSVFKIFELKVCAWDGEALRGATVNLFFPRPLTKTVKPWTALFARPNRHIKTYKAEHRFTLFTECSSGVSVVPLTVIYPTRKHDSWKYANRVFANITSDVSGLWRQSARGRRRDRYDRERGIAVNNTGRQTNKQLRKHADRQTNKKVDVG